jgi:hypothetical protein
MDVPAQTGDPVGLLTLTLAVLVIPDALAHGVAEDDNKLLYGVLSGIHLNPYIVDAIIGLSVVYKALSDDGQPPVW